MQCRVGEGREYRRALRDERERERERERGESADPMHPGLESKRTSVSFGY